ncbi:MAG: hypothetical protein H6Q00_858 [Holophagaceae bacterium]|nr:hypothetical protein [Holophagaceae bacterium]
MEQSPSGLGAYNGTMSPLPDLIAPLMAAPDAEPWVRFCAQCLERQRSCVLVTVLDAQPGAPCEKGEHFVYDADGHGLLPMDARFSIALHRLTQEALEKGPACVPVTTAQGEVMVSLEPFQAARNGLPCNAK